MAVATYICREGELVKHDQYATGKSQITYEILDYLVKHPDAQDALEGIVEWWLLEQKIERETAKVKEALAELVVEGLILERKGGDSRSFYKINQGKYGEIQALLGKWLKSDELKEVGYDDKK